MLAHGGTAGLVFELLFLAVPVLLFTVMAVVASRRSRRADPEAAELDELEGKP